MTNKLLRHKADIILVLSLLLVSAALVILMLANRTEGARVTVEVDGVLVATYSLSENGEWRIGETNTIVIENGFVYMKEADCPTESCIRTGKIRYVGESIVCLPNKVTVAIIGEGEGGVDFVS